MSEIKRILLLDVCEPLSEQQIYFINAAVGHRKFDALIHNQNIPHEEISKINIYKRDDAADYLNYRMGPSSSYACQIGKSTFVSSLLYFGEYLQEHPDDIFKVSFIYIYIYLLFN